MITRQPKKFFSSVGAAPDLKWEVGKLLKSKKYKKKSVFHRCKSEANIFSCGEWDYSDGIASLRCASFAMTDK